MKKFLPLLILSSFMITGCQSDKCVITESTFFLTMTNIQYFPKRYTNKEITLDCFTYYVSDVNNHNYLCGVRKCTAGFGCKCGKDTVIGFILQYDGDIPEPKNQYEDTNDKAWIHITGQLVSEEKTAIEINSYDANGNIGDQTEIVEFLSFNVSSLETIADYANLTYFVSK